MKVRIMFAWAGNVYDWHIAWTHPFFPSVGETFEFISFIDEEILKDFKDVKFKGRYQYSGLECSIAGMLVDCYNTKIRNINWMATKVELEITTDLYDNDPMLWEEVSDN